MKISFKLMLFVAINVIALNAVSQDVVFGPSNRSTTSLEKNILFYAPSRFSVTQSGSVTMDYNVFFNSNLEPAYSGPINPSDPYVLLIENLPDIHVQAGAWIGWTTRFWQSTKFKIEIFNTYNYGGTPGYPLPNTWVTVADVNNYGGTSFIAQVHAASVNKIRFTFYEAAGPNNSLGISELFFIHPEAGVAYDRLLVPFDKFGNVTIGTTAQQAKLDVNGTIRSREVKVETANWPDYVFKKDYKLTSLEDLDQYIKAKGHLPEMPSAKEAEANGIALGDMNKLLVKKIEELTLLLIEQNRENLKQNQKIDELKMKLDKYTRNSQ